MPLTHSPDPATLDTGPGTAAQQTARPRKVADYENGGWDDAPPPPVPATGATAGTPGTWTPAGCVVPADLAAVRAANIVANPATAWTIGQHVVTGAGQVHWDSDSWEAGVASLAATRAPVTRSAPAARNTPTTPTTPA